MLRRGNENKAQTQNNTKRKESLETNQWKTSTAQTELRGESLSGCRKRTTTKRKTKDVTGQITVTSTSDVNK